MMKKILSVIGITIPFVFGFAWFISLFLLDNIGVLQPTTVDTIILFQKIAGITALVGIAPMILGLVYLGREEHFTFGSILSEARKALAKDYWKYLLGLILLFAVQFVQNHFSEKNEPTSLLLSIIVILLGILYLWLDFGMKGMSLATAQGKEVKTRDVFADPKKFAKYFVAYLITWIFSFVGTFLLVVPGVFVALRLNMVPYLIIEKNLCPWQAIKASWPFTKGKTSNLFALNIILGFINILGLLAVVLGLFWTIPLFYVTTAVFYQRLQKYNLHHTK